MSDFSLTKSTSWQQNWKKVSKKMVKLIIFSFKTYVDKIFKSWCLSLYNALYNVTKLSSQTTYE